MARILLIEPDIILSTFCAQSLQAAGYEVDVTNDAQQAVHLADKHQPDAVVLELQLKRHNGIEFLYEFRSYGEWMHIPVIVYSYVPAGEFSQTAVLTNELGVVDYLYKPVTAFAKLQQRIRQLTAVSV